MKETELNNLLTISKCLTELSDFTMKEKRKKLEKLTNILII
jgi:hypothetical protein